MKQNCIHYFTDTHSSKGYVSLYQSNFGTLSHVFPLVGYPQPLVSSLISTAAAAAMERGHKPQWIHNCLDGNVRGLIIPKLSVGIINTPSCSATYSVSHLLNDDSKTYFDGAHHHFANALEIHDEWEKIYIKALNKTKMNKLAAETVDLILKDQSLDKEPTQCHRFFGAATVTGSVDFIENITQAVGKRYFIKGRPGTGKSTFLKKIAVEAHNRGFDTEVYHCAFDPDSVDMVILRELGVCLFDSTAPHEYFPTKKSDEIIDIYELAVAKGTDEKHEKEIKELSVLYKEEIAVARQYLNQGKQCCDKLQAFYLSAIDQQKAAQIQREILEQIAAIK